MTNKKIVIRANFKLSLNNPDRNKLTSSKDKSYIDKVIDYFSDDKKKVLNMLDYFTGKINKENEVNFVLENGNYATKEELSRRKKYISKQFNNSNIWQVVLSIPSEFVDDNITWRDLEIKLAKEIIPKTLKKMGFNDVKKMSYGFSLHMNTKHPHFHIYFIEKSPNFKNYNNELQYRRKGDIPKNVINYLKKEIILTIERESKFKPLSVEINNEIEEFKEYFKPSTKNFVLHDKNNILLEDKIMTLGRLLDERELYYNSKIKFNSIKNAQIEELTKEIKRIIFKDNDNIGLKQKEFKDKINNMNSYLISIVKENKLNKFDIDLSYTKSKEKYLNNYIMNSIVNHSRYYYRKNKNRILINSNDVIQSIILNNYKENRSYSKSDILTNALSSNSYINKGKIMSAVKNINDEMEEAVEEFDKLFQVDKGEENFIFLFVLLFLIL